MISNTALEAAFKKSREIAVPLVVASLAVLVLALSFREEPSPDTYFHLAAGRRIVAHGWLPWQWELPRTNVYLAFERDHPFVDHEWLFQVVAWAVYSVGGAELLGLAKAAVVLAAFFFLWRALAPIGPASALAAILPAVLVAESRFLARPEVVTLAGTTFVLWLMERDRREPRAGNLVFAGLAQVAWSSCHGFALLGPSIAGAGFVAQVVGWLLGEKRARLVGLDASGARPLRAMVFLLVLVLSSLANPYFIEGALYPVLIALRTGKEWSTAGLYMRIVEVQSPFTAALANVFEIRLLKLEIAAGVLLALVTIIRRRARLEHLLVSALLTGMGVMYLRCVPFAAVGLALPIAAGLAETGAILAGRRAALARAVRSLALATTAALALVASRAALSDELHTNAQYDARAGLGFSDFLRYDAAVNFFETSPPPGNMFNNFGAGHFLIFARDEKEPLPYICGNTELYPAEFLVEYHKVISGESDYQAIFDARKISDVLIDHRVEVSRELIIRLAQDPRWRLVHLDSHALIFRRVPGASLNGFPPPPPLPPAVDLAVVARDASSLFSYRDESTEDSFGPVRLLRNLHLLPRRKPVPLERLHVASLLDTLGFPDEALALAKHAYQLRPDFAPALFVLASLERRADPRSAEEHALELAELIPDAPYPHVSAGLAALGQGQPKRAAKHFQDALDRDPLNELAAVNLLAAYMSEDPPNTVELRRALANPAVSAPYRSFYEGAAAESDNDLTRAVDAYKKALALRPTLVLARYRLGGCLLKQGQFALAKTELEACALATPNDGDVRQKLGVARLKVGDRPQGKRDLARAAELLPRDPQPLVELGRAALEDRDLDLATSSAESALRRDPRSKAARALLEDARRARN